MVSTEEIVERSLYMNLLAVALQANVTIDPDLYLDPDTHLPTQATLVAYEAAKDQLDKFVGIFGVGNNQSRGAKITPRITLELQGYYPGNLGLEKYYIDDSIKDNPKMRETSYLAKDVSIDVHLVASNQVDMRLLHSIMYKALPDKGYIKPYTGNREEFFSPGLFKSGNIYLEIGNHYNHNDNDHGILECVYTYNIIDGVVHEYDTDIEIVPMVDASVFINTQSSDVVSKLHVYKTPYNSLKPVTDYLYEVEYSENLSLEVIQEYYRNKYRPESFGSCSTMRKDNFFMRNFDWYYSEYAEFVIHCKGKYKVLGVGGNNPNLTNTKVKHKVEAIEDYTYLPYNLVDGINETGLCASVLTVPKDFGDTTGTNPDKPEMCMMYIIRYILDNHNDAYEACCDIRDNWNVYAPKMADGNTQEFHFFISDKDGGNYCLEFIHNQAQIIDISNRPIATNFHLHNVEFDDNNYPLLNTVEAYGNGLERFNLMSEDYFDPDNSLTLESLISKFENYRYTLTYTTPWRTEFCGFSEDLTVLNAFENPEVFDEIVSLALNRYNNRSREEADTWHTEHYSAYNIEARSLHLCTQEDFTKIYEFDL